ncbi:hypothetical protein GQ53DRAFT_754118 [Thozetella sp. PMI_491]|nr:hypothetical protein GQ53DRAFT_754118 [Thozetella sp. PMI_491]
MSHTGGGFPPIESITIFPAPNHDNWHPDEQLHRSAEYGRVPFDSFALEHWDEDAPVEQDQEQWDRLAKQYLALGQYARQKHDQLSRNAQDLVRGPGYHPGSGGQPQMPTQAQIDRIFRPHQTVQERNICCKDIGQDKSRIILWLRTCYLPELEAKYHDMATRAEVGGNASSTVYVTDDNHMLDNQRLYDFGSDWRRILTRIPELASGYYIHRPWNQEDETEWEKWDEEMQGRAAQGERTPLPFPSVPDEALCTPVYVLDEEALRGDFVKIFWLNQFGECMWENKIHPGDMEMMLGSIFDGCISDYIEESERGEFLV